MITGIAQILRMLTGMLAYVFSPKIRPNNRGEAQSIPFPWSSEPGYTKHQLCREADRLAADSVRARATKWLAGTGTSESSQTIFDVMMAGSPGFIKQYSKAEPCDAADFGRCARLLELIPEWISRLDEVATVCPSFRRLVRCWPELTRLYECGKLALLTAVIKDLRGPGGAVRLTVKREWEITDFHIDKKYRLAPGTYDMERIMSPLGYNHCWFVLRGTRVGATEGFWRQWAPKQAGSTGDETFDVIIEELDHHPPRECREWTCPCGSPAVFTDYNANTPHLIDPRQYLIVCSDCGNRMMPA